MLRGPATPHHALLRLTWWILVVVVVIGLGLAAALYREPEPDDVLVLPFVGYSLVGAVVAYRRPSNAVGWVFLLAGALLSLGSLASVGVDHALAVGPPASVVSVWATWVDHVFWFPTFMLATAFTCLLFPEGLPSPRWKPVLWLAVVGTVTGTLVLALNPQLDLDQRGVRPGAYVVDNPLTPPFIPEAFDLRASWWWYLPVILSLCGVLAGLVAAVVRFRRSRGTERQQMRLFAIAAVLLPLCAPNTITFALALSFIPVACGLAVLRYRLYDIDRIISRTTAYVLVTGVLVAVYVVVVTAVSIALPRTGTLAVTAATLTAAAVFRPALTRARRWVNRHFNRERYDAELAVEAFARRIGDAVDTPEIERELLQVVGATVQPKAVRLTLYAIRG